MKPSRVAAVSFGLIVVVGLAVWWLSFVSPQARFYRAENATRDSLARADSLHRAQLRLAAKLKSDLRNLLVAQEAYYSAHRAYANVVALLPFRSSVPEASIKITSTGRDSWSASTEVTDSSGVVACTIRLGTGDVATWGEPQCLLASEWDVDGRPTVGAQGRQ